MIRKDFMEIIQYLRSLYRGMIDLSTNAILINSENVKEIIRNVDRIDISIDGRYLVDVRRFSSIFQPDFDTYQIPIDHLCFS